jgi:twitching motility protein PilT
MQLEAILKAAVDGEASDVHFKVGLPPVLRVHGHLYPFAQCPPLSREALQQFAATLCPDRYVERFSLGEEIDFCHSFAGIGRFRVHLFRTRDNPGLVLRHIPGSVRSFRELRLPPALEEIAQAPAGLVLVTGEGGGGKSTTLAAMVDHVNRRRTCHIVTIEDPIELLFVDNHSVIDQREVGTDSKTFHDALRAARREDVNVLLLSALPDRETIDLAVEQAEAGRLVLAAVPGAGGRSCLERLAGLFPAEQHALALRRIGAAAVATVTLRLVPTEDGTARMPDVQVERAFGDEPTDAPPGAVRGGSRFGEGERWFSPE